MILTREPYSIARHCLLVQLAEARKRAEEVPPEALDEVKKRAAKEIDTLQKKLDEAEAARQRAESSKKKLQSEVGGEY